MKRLILSAILAGLLAACAQPGTQAPADTGKTIPLHQLHGGMDVQGMQCMAKGDGCCCAHHAVPGQPAACKPGGTCGCCHHKEAM